MAEARPLPIVFGTDRVPGQTVTQWDRRESSGAGIPPNYTVRIAVCQGPATYWRIWRDGNLVPFYGATQVDAQGVIYHNQQSHYHFDKGGKFSHLSLLAHIVNDDMSWEWHQGDWPETVWTYPGIPGTGRWVWTGGYSDSGSPTYVVTSGASHPYPNDVATDPRPPLSGVAHVRAVRYAAPNGDTLPRIEFEIRGKHRSGGASPAATSDALDDDANPADVIVTLLTDTQFGLGLPLSAVEVDTGSDGSASSSFRRYCQAAGLYVSRAIVTQTTVRELLAGLLQATNSIVVQSEGRLKIRPLGDKVVTGNGVTYTPHNESTAIGLEDIKDDVVCERASDADVYNCWPVVFRNRANMGNPYAEQTAEVIVQGDAITRGVRRAGPTTNEWIKRESHARLLSQWLGARSVMRRNRYRFTLGPRHSLLEPGDFLSITDPDFGLAGKLCRLVSTEWTNGEIQCVAEEWPGEPYGLHVVTHLTPGDGMSSRYRPPLEQVRDSFALMSIGNIVPFTLPVAKHWAGLTELAAAGSTQGRLVAVGEDACVTSDDGGRNWTSRTIPAGVYRGVAYNGSNLLAAVGTSSVCSTSPDGVTWTSRTIPGSPGNYHAVGWGSGLFVAVGVSICATSPDGITWTERTIPAGTYDAVHWNGFLWVAVGENAACATSPDGITWTDRTMPLGYYTGVTYGSNMWVAVGTDSLSILGFIATSTDGITWDARAEVGHLLKGIAFGSGIYVAVGYDSTYSRDFLSTSRDGFDWRTVNPSMNVTFSAVAYSTGFGGTREAFTVIGYPLSGSTSSPAGGVATIVSP